MDENWIQVRLRRVTRERLREYARRVTVARGLSPGNRANEGLSPEECVSLLLGQWESRQEQTKKRRKKG